MAYKCIDYHDKLYVYKWILKEFHHQALFTMDT